MLRSETVWRIIDAVSLVFSEAYIAARARAASHASPIVRLLALRDHADWQAKILERELAVLRSQRASVAPKNRTHYSPEQRAEIIQIMRLRGWSTVKTAERFVVHPNTIRAWRKAIRGEARKHLIGSPPWNRIHDGVRWLVHQVSRMCPEKEFGTRTIARRIMRAGVRISSSSVRRILDEEPPKATDRAAKQPDESDKDFKPCALLNPRSVNHVWHTDLTCIHFLWFRWTVMGVIDGFSRKLLALRLFVGAPTSAKVIRVMQRAMRREGTPRYLITDHGCQFRTTFEAAMKAEGIRKVARGRIGNAKMNGKIERVFRTLKLWQRLALMPMNPRAAQRRLDAFRTWYNRHRCHAALGVRTPEEVKAGCDPPEPIPIRSIDDVDPVIHVRRENFDGDTRLPVIDIRVRLERRKAA